MRVNKSVWISLGVLVFISCKALTQDPADVQTTLPISATPVAEITATQTPPRLTAIPLPSATATVSPTPPTLEEWTITSPEEQGVDSGRLADMLAYLQTQPHHIHSILVVRRNHLTLEVYFPPYSALERHQIYSCTKSVTSALVGIAIDNGFISDVNQTLPGLFPQAILDEEQKKGISLENLLTMTSGLEWSEADEPVRSGNNMYSYVPLEADPVQFVLKQAVIHPPGTVYNYNSGGSHLLSCLVQTKSRQNTHKFAQERLFAPLGIQQSLWLTDELDTPLGGSGLALTARAMAKFGQLYLQEGAWEGKQIVSQDWVKDSTRKHIKVGEGMDYGYQWWILAGQGYLANGWGGQQILVYPRQEAVVVFTSGTQNAWLPHRTLTDNYILPAMKTGKLPQNQKEVQRLNAIIQAIEQPMPQEVPALPQTAQEIRETMYLVTGECPVGLNMLSFDFRQSEVMLDGSVGDFDFTGWKAGLDGIYRVNVLHNEEKIALKGEWENERTFRLDWRSLPNAEETTLWFNFGEEKITVDTYLNVEDYRATSEVEILSTTP